jgi:hypothetical protein
MAKAEVRRRVKSYSAESGITYQYCFYAARKGSAKSGAAAVYTYLVSADRKNSFPLHIHVERNAIRNWEKRVGRTMTGTEEYALAKLRLLRGFDEAEECLPANGELLVDESNLDELITQLDL